MQSDNRIKKFFEGVEQASNTLDLNLIDSQYADQFIFADPNGTRVVEKQKFLAFLPQRQDFFKSIGHQSTKVLSLDETKLDDQYTMVKAHFVMTFQKSSGQSIEAKVASTYFLFMKGDSPKIVMHMEHEDLKEAMQSRGIL
jgi:ketosteroid isomerase-like protein